MRGMSRIFNGEIAPEPIPWQVLIWMASNFQCGGTILDEKTILTARHCVKDSYDIKGHFERTLVMAGSTNAFGGILIPVERFILFTDTLFKGYNINEHDLAILKLATPLPFSDHIQPICLPTEDLTIPYGMECIISGWGITSKTDTSVSNLYKIYNPFPIAYHVDQLPLDLKWGKIRAFTGQGCNDQPDSNNTICLIPMHYPPTTPCHGDSGGPLVCMQNSVPVLTGVAHAAKGRFACGKMNKVFRYVSVTPHLNWIKQNMVKLSN